MRSCKLAVVIERGLARTTAPDGGGRYPRRRLTINTGTAVTKFHDERDILQSWASEGHSPEAIFETNCISLNHAC